MTNHKHQKLLALFGGLLLFFISPTLEAQHSIAREWNEQLLHSIRDDFARPTVHARNLFHISAAMYDAWTVFETGDATPYLLGNSLSGFEWAFEGFTPAGDIEAARDEAISYAAYRLIEHRFSQSPGRFITMIRIRSFFQTLGYDPDYTLTDYQSTGSAAALGNYIAEGYIQYGLIDGANEQNDYGNLYYEPSNPPLLIATPGIDTIADPNRWQPISFDEFVDQAGNPLPTSVPEFLSPEWGAVHPFALAREDLTVYQRDSGDYWVYHDPGPPPFISMDADTDGEAQYLWGFELVALWSRHLSPADEVMWDISPASIGNIESYPSSFADYPEFYKALEGGDPSRGHSINPYTGQPYTPQMIPRGDYARILAEFWADGPDSETPPGHWFTIFNYVSDHPELSKQIGGTGNVVSDLEWDVKGYFLLGGAMHDAAITAWGIKGYYDYIRPVSAIRWLAGIGQRTDPTLPGYDPNGINLVEGRIEVVQNNDPDFPDFTDYGKIKVRAWKGPDFIEEPDTDEAGVGWILAEEWWPYQRPSFVTPPFAGYISGHSTYSSAAAEVMELFTGDAFFPGGMGEFEAPQNEFLVFEEGPSMDVTLQWATYRDASDQCSLSRIWGGIHPPADDIPGRIIGIDIGNDAYNRANQYWEGRVTNLPEITPEFVVYPNPTSIGQTIQFEQAVRSFHLYLPDGRLVREGAGQAVETIGLRPGLYILHAQTATQTLSTRIYIR